MYSQFIVTIQIFCVQSIEFREKEVFYHSNKYFSWFNYRLNYDIVLSNI